jgi:hypothetical protein
MGLWFEAVVVMLRHRGLPQGSFGGEVGVQWGGYSSTPRAPSRPDLRLEDVLDVG